MSLAGHPYPSLSSMPSSLLVSSLSQISYLYPPQVKYAALDVLIAGQVFRGLRLWHRSPSPCAGCLQPLGAVQQLPPDLACDAAGCGRSFKENVQAYLHHCRTAGHAAAFGECSECGCLRPAEALARQQLVKQAPQAVPSVAGEDGEEEEEQQEAKRQRIS